MTRDRSGSLTHSRINFSFTICRRFSRRTRRINMESEQSDSRQYKVVINHEEQYSIWAMDKSNPPGWNDVGKSGTKDECLDYIERVWTDMRPLSVRRHLESLGTAQQPTIPSGEHQ